MARDQEYAAYNTNTIGLGGSYEFRLLFGASWFKKGTLNLHYDHIMINYKDFRDLAGTRQERCHAGHRAALQLSADVIQLFISFWF